METFTRNELVMLHTQVHARINRMDEDKACQHPVDHVRESNQRYRNELRALGNKLSRMIDAGSYAQHDADEAAQARANDL